MAHIFSTILGFPLITMSLMFYGLGLETKCFYSTIMKDIPVDSVVVTHIQTVAFKDR